MRYRVVEWPEAQEVVGREDAICIVGTDFPVYAVPDEHGDYVLYEWPESQDVDGYHVDGNAVLAYEPLGDKGSQNHSVGSDTADYERIASDIIGLTMSESEAVEYYGLDISPDDFILKMLNYDVELCAHCMIWQESASFNEDENMCCCDCCPCD